MRIHANTLTQADVRDAAKVAGVSIIGLGQHGSRKRARAFDVALSGSGAHRSQYGDRDTAAATWDEWGIFLGALFAKDASVTIPRVYENSSDFSFKTGGEYDGGSLDRPGHKQHKWTFDLSVPYQNTCKCGAIRRWTR